ncbi:MAG: hypothetical protein K0R43_230 [Pseudoduganella sp.]|jgi:hypothetical protein|nr:hypothetical protein [Pseudoduganella sp.]
MEKHRIHAHRAPDLPVPVDESQPHPEPVHPHNPDPQDEPVPDHNPELAPPGQSNAQL